MLCWNSPLCGRALNVSTTPLLQRLRREWQIFLLAVGFLSRLPVPPDPNFSQDKLDGAARYFPAVGLLLGAITALSLLAFHRIFDNLPLAVLLSMALGLLVSGAFHEDGLADSADGFGGGWQRDDVLRIMKDSRIGTYGTVALTLTLAIKALSLSSMPSAGAAALALLLAQALSRWLAVSYLIDLRYVSGEGKSKPLATALPLRHWWLAGLPLLIPAMATPIATWLPLALCLLIFRFGFGRYLRRRLGGYSGDALGAAQQISEVLIYLVLLALYR